MIIRSQKKIRQSGGRIFETHKNWKFTTYPNATHLMIDGEGTPTNEEYKTKGHVNQAFIEDMASFIKNDDIL